MRSEFQVCRPSPAHNLQVWTYTLISEAMKENKDTTCTPCERDFEHKVDELVHEGQAPSHEEREKREKEVKAAFSEQGKEQK